MDHANFKNLILEYTRKINENTNKTLSPACEQYGLTISQARILLMLYQQGIHTIGSLGNDLCVAGANISAMCKKLETRGLVHRTRDQDDERVVVVSLTAEGNQIMQEVDEALNRKLMQHLEERTGENFEEMIEVLKKLNELMEKINSEK
ncbi:MarR family winged helix-turn-helix transcriptional regulator [Dehalobacterium formicoaceticum]|uniref:MarR family winged helix-turn-helix transcriptional regulator n=1 Tax=Dehalobacterium formicoaceticum TaxID=51515 RepID=A0ABT1Y260_9FIRM|nr:MarR family winged helix-turn-helix transcriptional regulator [Dehalobacterium formicoaceticum]MCR6544270.1 MarR family winged helix-turn-helix transcriptional regulator [Dehalobacterium formicoaceticum]